MSLPFVTCIHVHFFLSFLRSWWIVLGGEDDSTTNNPFTGCVSGLNVLGRGINFLSDIPNLQTQVRIRYYGFVSAKVLQILV